MTRLLDITPGSSSCYSDFICGFRYRSIQRQVYGVGRPTNLYVIQEGRRGPFKFGLARDPLDRLSTLQQGNPREIRLVCFCPGNYSLERFIHRELAEHRVSGEWFSFCTDVLSVADEVLSWSEMCQIMDEQGGGSDCEDVEAIVADRVAYDWKEYELRAA